MRMTGRNFDRRPQFGATPHTYTFSNVYGERRVVKTAQGEVPFRFAFGVVEDDRLRRNILARREKDGAAIVQLVYGNNLGFLGEDMRAAHTDTGTRESGLDVIEDVRHALEDHVALPEHVFSGVVRNMSLLALSHVRTKTTPPAQGNIVRFQMDDPAVFPAFLHVIDLYQANTYNTYGGLHEQLHGRAHGPRASA